MRVFHIFNIYMCARLVRLEYCNYYVCIIQFVSGYSCFSNTVKIDSKHYRKESTAFEKQE